MEWLQKDGESRALHPTMQPCTSSWNDKGDSMAKKKAFALRVDEERMKAIERWANDEFRSVNGQIEWMLDQQLKAARRNPKKKS